jgi:hypothetical protein
VSLEQNIMDAEDAIRYVKHQVSLGAGTHAGDLYRSGGATRGLVDRTRAAVRARGPNADFQVAVTVAAKAVQAGNCGEQSYVAFGYLTEQLKRRNIAVVILEQWNHQFVVVGATGLMGVNFTSISSASPPARWGAEAVVCDPWLGMSFDVNQHWTASIATILKMTLPGRVPPAGTKAKVVATA